MNQDERSPQQPSLQRVLQERFGLEAFRPGQREAIETLLDHRRLLAIQPTGHGKSLLYQLPAVLVEGMTLVISPLLALMRDQIHQLRTRFDIAAGSVNSDQTDEENDQVMDEAMAGQLRILFVAPERLDNLGFEAFIRSLPVDLVVVDEAHCISTWGHDFRPSYRQIVRATHALESARPGMRVLGLTATADARTESDIVDQFRGADGTRPRIHREPMDRPNLHLAVAPVNGLDEKLATLARFLDGREGCGILYCATREQTEIVAGFLRDQDIEVSAYHAGLAPDAKRSIQQGFVSGRRRVLAATNALGMGIDKPDIRFIVHVDVPGSITAYYQEVGRAGRDGARADGLLLFDVKDRDVQDYFIRSAQPSAKDFEKVREACTRADATRRDVAVRTGLHPTKVTVILAELIEQGFLEKRMVARRQVYCPLNRNELPDLSRYERQLAVRTKELEAMLRFGRQDVECLMATLRRALGDDEAPPCGRCPLCDSSLALAITPEESKVAAARRWVVHRELVIGATRAPLMDAGFTLLDGEVRSPLFVEWMNGRADPDRREIPAELRALLETRVDTLQERHSFAAVVAIPSGTWAQRDQTATWIADRLGVPFVADALFWTSLPESRQGELLNNDQRRQNVAGRLHTAPGTLPDGPVLLLDDYHGSCNTLKEAVRALRKGGGIESSIVPITLARVRWRLGSRGMI